MGDWPDTINALWPRTVFSTVGPGSLRDVIRPLNNNATTQQAWPAANRAIYVPILVERQTTIYQLGIYNGAVNGNVSCGIYSYPGTGTSATRLASVDTAMSGANQWQLFDITDQVLAPGIYYLAGVCSTVTTATFQRTSPASQLLQAFGVEQEALGSTSVPVTATFAVLSSAFLPIMAAIGTTAF